MELYSTFWSTHQAQGYHLSRQTAGPRLVFRVQHTSCRRTDNGISSGSLNDAASQSKWASLRAVGCRVATKELFRKGDPAGLLLDSQTPLLDGLSRRCLLSALVLAVGTGLLIPQPSRAAQGETGIDGTGITIDTALVAVLAQRKALELLATRLLVLEKSPEWNLQDSLQITPELDAIS
eukprot:9475299-Pyramimonas_sp.AAC.2